VLNPDAERPLHADDTAMTTLAHRHPRRSLEVACLECSSCRYVSGLSNDELGVCLTCGYIGWALAQDVTYADVHTAASPVFAFSS
jgi:hypothetical protein